MKSTTIQGWLNGEFLRSEWLRKQYKLIALICVLVFIYILVGYQSMQQQHQLSDLRKEVRDKKFEYLSLSTQLVNMTRQSYIAEELVKSGSKLKENKKPAIRVE